MADGDPIQAPYNPVTEIAGNPDAHHDWDERLGIMLADGVRPTAAELAILRNRVLKRYGLTGAYKARKAGAQG
jgi:hypothetical protein